MINEVKGNIFANIGSCDAICVTTNLQLRKNGSAICGAGIARVASLRWKEFEAKLGKLISNGGIGVVVVLNESGTNILSFPTKYHWKDSSSVELISKSMVELIKISDEMSWKRILLPRPGCQNGKLSWEKEVRPTLDSIVKK